MLGHLPPLTYKDVKGNIGVENNYGQDISGASVPYRQLAFGPDWFSTELTTATTNFILIVPTHQVAPNGNFLNPRFVTEHVVQLYVELAPDILVETPTGYDGSGYPTGAGGALDTAKCG